MIFLLLLFNLLLIKHSKQNVDIDPKQTRVWGPGLEPHRITMPARYFFIQAVDTKNHSINNDLGLFFESTIEGISNLGKPCRIWSNTLNRKDGSFIIRYKLYEPCKTLKITLKHENTQIAESPYLIRELSLSDDCNCPKSVQTFLDSFQCGPLPDQIALNLASFHPINWEFTRAKLIAKFDQPHSISLCHYIVKNNEIYRNCYGKYVGFKMFVDAILLSLTRKVQLPDLEFFANLGDWPLVKKGDDLLPVFSWCGSTATDDILMPTYDITESSLENMGRVMLDMLSVQGNVEFEWHARKPQAFWRGRDSNQHRLDLIDISRENPDLFNVSLTNFFFFRDQQEKYGRSDHVSFFEFFNYKYQLALDGTVAAYRFPYLLAGGSLVFKQESQYFEYFYPDLEPYVHYVPVKKDLSDLVEKIKWAKENDVIAQEIAKNGQEYANVHLLPRNIFCYYTQLFVEFSERITSEVRVLESMEKVDQIKEQANCDCSINIKDEL